MIQDPQLRDKLDRYQSRLAAAEKEWAETLAHIDATRPCKKHPDEILRLDRQRSIEASAIAGEKTLILRDCDACARDAKARSFAQRVGIPPTLALATARNWIEHGDTLQIQGQRDLIAACRHWVSAPKENRARPTFLFLCGRVGSGKSHLAAALCKASGHPARDCLWKHHEQLIGEVKETYSKKTGKASDTTEHRLQTLLRAPLLIWDDAGTGRHSADDIAILTRVMSGRVDNGTSTIVTTNLTVQALLTALFPERTQSRVKQLYESHWLDWPDFRVRKTTNQK